MNVLLSLMASACKVFVSLVSLYAFTYVLHSNAYHRQSKMTPKHIAHSIFSCLQ